jgi:hypothetical protein
MLRERSAVSTALLATLIVLASVAALWIAVLA